MLVLRTKLFPWSSAIQYVGFAVIPGNQYQLVTSLQQHSQIFLLLYRLGFVMSLIDFHVGSLPINQLTLPGYFFFVVNIIVVVSALNWMPSGKQPQVSQYIIQTLSRLYASKFIAGGRRF